MGAEGASMTKASFLQMYGDELVRLESYYKYSFGFRGVQNHLLYVSFGGSSGDIYRSKVTAGEILSVKDLDEREGINFAMLGNEVLGDWPW